jgi:hypothetical protein
MRWKILPSIQFGRRSVQDGGSTSWRTIVQYQPSAGSHSGGRPPSVDLNKNKTGCPGRQLKNIRQVTLRYGLAGHLLPGGSLDCR